jgi:hypothetical protein
LSICRSAFIPPITAKPMLLRSMKLIRYRNSRGIRMRVHRMPVMRATVLDVDGSRDTGSPL